jgi:hypothetical protein
MGTTTLFADVTPLLEAVGAVDEARVIAQTLSLLGPQRVPPAKLAGRVGLAALWGGADPHAVSALSATGQIAQWMRTIPLGPEPEAEERRALAPALPLVQGFLAVARGVRDGIAEPHPSLPEPLMPAEVQNPGGPLGGLREALAKRDTTQAQRILVGYNATGADYRAVLATLYGALDYRYPEHGHPLIFLLASERVLAMADWGGNMPPLISWYVPLLMDNAPDAPAAQAARAYGSAPEHDLSWLRKRLAIPNEESAGPEFQRALLAGDASAACAALLAALRAGATPQGVAAGMALAAASRIAATPEGDRASLMRAGHVLLYVHAVHVGMRQVQDPQTWPILYTAAAAVNSLRGVGGTLESGRAPVSTGAGGLIAPTMLRSLEAQVSGGEMAGALAIARRYVQMGHAPDALAGILGGVAALRDTAGGEPEALHTMPLVAAAAAEYLSLPPALRSGGQNALLAAAVRLASELRGAYAVADRVRAAIDAQVVAVGR